MNNVTNEQYNLIYKKPDTPFVATLERRCQINVVSIFSIVHDVIVQINYKVLFRFQKAFWRID